MNKPTCTNESANEISPPIEVVLIKEEIADTCLLQDDNALEEEETLDENDEFSAPKSSANMNDDMQYSSSSSEERNMENFLNRVKTETEFNIIHEEIEIKDERFFEATDSKSENKSNKKLLNGATNKPDEFSVLENPENMHDNIQYSSSFCKERHMENFLNRVKKETGLSLIHEEIQIKDERLFVSTDFDSEEKSNDKLLSEGKNKPDCNSTSSEGGKIGGLKDQNVDCGSLKKYSRNQTGERLFKCITCEKTFTQVHHLNRHKLTHTGEKLFVCDICHKTFNQLGNLTVHKRIHNNERPFKCSVCHKVFTQLHNLNRHKFIHTGEKLHECRVCRKIFYTKSNLIVHKQIHENEQPFECSVCHKTFTRSDHRNEHMRTHTGEKPFKCHVCQYKCSQSAKLKRHMRIHTGEKPFTCKHCQRTFNFACSLKRHMQTKHNDKI